jgi:hypothetical protein
MERLAESGSQGVVFEERVFILYLQTVDEFRKQQEHRMLYAHDNQGNFCNKKPSG